MIRITTSEVCALGRFSRATLWRRVKAGTLPAPVDQSREAIFDRERVVAALAVARRRWRPARPTGDQDGSSSNKRKGARRWTADRWAVA